MLEQINFILFSSAAFLMLTNAYSTPVLLWGAETEAKPAFPPITLDEFADVIRPLLEQHMIVAFLENELTPRDFLCFKPGTKEPCYLHMRLVRQKTYYANVEQALEALYSFENQVTRNTINGSGQLEVPMSCEVGYISVIELNSSFPERALTLETHDAQIGDISKRFTCPVVYLYMSNSDSIASRSEIPNRMRRSNGDSTSSTDSTDTTTPTDSTTSITSTDSTDSHDSHDSDNTGDSKQNLFYGPRVVIYFSKLTVTTKLNVTSLDIIGIDQTETDSKMTVVLTTKEKKALTFDVVPVGSYYVIKSFSYNSIRYHAQDVETPSTFSYYCSSLAMRHMGTTLEWKDLQFQVQSATGQTFTKFNEAWHCVSFFSVGIISGIFVMIFLLSILFCGIAWIMDINSTDRFEDAQGKHLVIHAED